MQYSTILREFRPPASMQAVKQGQYQSIGPSISTIWHIGFLLATSRSDLNGLRAYIQEQIIRQQSCQFLQLDLIMNVCTKLLQAYNKIYLHDRKFGGLLGHYCILADAGAGATAAPAGDAVDDSQEFVLELSSEAGHGSEQLYMSWSSVCGNGNGEHQLTRVYQLAIVCWCGYL